MLISKPSKRLTEGHLACWRNSNAIHSPSDPRISRDWSASAPIWAARSSSTPNARTAIRDWPSAATSCGNSKYITPDAIASNADTLVSIGGVQSNHTRMVAAVAAKIGMKCRLVQEAWVPHEDAVYDRVGNIMLSRIMGADVRLVDDGFDIGIRKSWEAAIADVKAG